MARASIIFYYMLQCVPECVTDGRNQHRGCQDFKGNEEGLFSATSLLFHPNLPEIYWPMLYIQLTLYEYVGEVSINSEQRTKAWFFIKHYTKQRRNLLGLFYVLCIIILLVAMYGIKTAPKT